jgi:hypothetical protein
MKSDILVKFMRNWKIILILIFLDMFHSKMKYKIDLKSCE